MRGALRQNSSPVIFFPASGPLQFVAMVILGPHPKTSHGYQYVLVITDCSSKVTRAILVRNTTAAKVAEQFLTAWLYPYGTPTYHFTDNGPQFLPTIFEAVCGMLAVRQLPTTAHHPETNSQGELFNRALATRSRPYVSEHQTDWANFAQPLTYMYNMQLHRSTGKRGFDLLLTRNPKR